MPSPKTRVEISKAQVDHARAAIRSSLFPTDDPRQDHPRIWTITTNHANSGVRRLRVLTVDSRRHINDITGATARACGFNLNQRGEIQGRHMTHADIGLALESALDIPAGRIATESLLS